VSADRLVTEFRPALDRESYFLAAYELIGEAGCDGLTIAALCEQLGVTKGSFYYHFADLPEFVTAFATRWQGWLQHLIEAYLAEPDPMRRLELLTNSHIVTMIGAEPAIRAWGRTEPAVAAATRAVDESVKRFGLETIGPIVGDHETAAMLTRMSLALLIGMQQRQDDVDLALSIGTAQCDGDDVGRHETESNPGDRLAVRGLHRTHLLTVTRPKV